MTDKQDKHFDELDVKDKQKTERKLILAVATDGDNYYVDIPAGSNVAETAFGVHCLIRMLVRDGIIKNSKVFTDMVAKYLGDSQYGEVE